MEDKELTTLIGRAQAGDQGAMEALLQKAHTPVSYQCRKLLRDPRDVEDMTQEVLLLVYTRLSLLKNPAAFWGWLNSITVNRCMNALKRTHIELQFAEDEEGHSVLDDLEELDEQQVPDKALDNTETTRMIEEIVSALPEAQRICTLMYYYDEMSVREIAEAVGVPENTVKSRLNYARKIIKERVLDYEKQGVKLYGLSPLPFLLYFLGRSAGESADAAQASAAARQIMACAAGTTSAAAGAASSAGTAAAGTATGGAASTAGTAAAHVLGGLSVKAVAGVLAGVLAVGGIVGTVALVNREDEPEPSPSVSETLPAEDETVSPSPSLDPPPSQTPTESVNPMDLIPEDPGPPDSPYDTETVYDPSTYISRTTLVGGPANLEVYYEIPVFPETTEGIKSINTYFREERDSYFRDENGFLARLLETRAAWDSSETFLDNYRCNIHTFNDEITSVGLVYNTYTGGAMLGTENGYTFRSDTGAALSVPELLGRTPAECSALLTQAMRDEGLLEWADYDPNADVTQYPFYVSDGAVNIGVDMPSYRGTYFVRIPAPLQFGGGGNAQADPTAALNSIAYYGDPAQCRMTPEQAGAFIDALHIHEAQLEQEYQAGNYASSSPDDSLLNYAALVDPGNGVPLLITAGGLSSGGDSRSFYWDYLSRLRVWQYIDGQAVELSLNGAAGLVAISEDGIWTGWSGDYPYHYEIRNLDAALYPFADGTLLGSPAHTLYGKQGEFQIDGVPVTEGEMNAALEAYGAGVRVSMGYGGGPFGACSGVTPAEDVLAVLEKF